MNYMVRLDDGSEYGPADMNLLSQWAAQQRIPASAQLVPDDGGPPVAVLDVPELRDALTAPQPTSPPASHPPTSVNYGLPLMARSGKRFIFAIHAELPDRCLRCGAEVGPIRKNMRLAYVTPLAYLGILGGLLPLLILILVLQKTARVRLPMCQRHRTRRVVGMLLTWLGFLGGLALFLTALLVFENGLVVLLGIVLMFASLIYGALTIPFVVPTRITKQYVAVKRCHPSILDGLPELDVDRLP